MTERIVAVVPVRSFRRGKTRLARTLDPATRETLIRRMADGVLRALAATRTIEATIVVSPDADVLAWAASLPQTVVPVEQPATSPGLDAAIDAGRRAAVDENADAVLSLFADLPLVTSPDIDELVSHQSGVVLGADRRGTGTNALLLRLDPAGKGFRFSFGAGSLERHIAEARRMELSIEMPPIPGIAFDLDTPEDWCDLESSNPGGYALLRGQLVECGAAAP